MDTYEINKDFFGVMGSSPSAGRPSPPYMVLAANIKMRTASLSTTSCVYGVPPGKNERERLKLEILFSTVLYVLPKRSSKIVVRRIIVFGERSLNGAYCLLDGISNWTLEVKDEESNFFLPAAVDLKILTISPTKVENVYGSVSGGKSGSRAAFNKALFIWYSQSERI